MPPTGRAVDEQAAGPVGHRRRRVDLRAGDDLGERVGQAVRGVEAARDDRQVACPGAQQGGSGGPCAAAGSEHDRPLGHLGERREQPEPVGQIAANPAFGRKAERVDGACVARLGAELVAQRDGSGLVRQRDVDAVQAERPQAAHGRGQVGRRHAQGDVDAVEPERLGGRVVHARRARVLDRVADHAGDARRAGDRHAGCVCWKCWKSAKVREKWWRRSLSPGIAT